MDDDAQMVARVLVDKRAFLSRSPERGEIVVFRSPADAEARGARPGVNYIKRVIALEGDRVSVKGGAVRVNDTPLGRGEETDGCRQETAGERTYPVCLGAGGAEFPEATVPRGCIFVLGDNRADSKDRRNWGPIPVRDLVGPVIYLYWSGTSWSRFGVIR